MVSIWSAVTDCGRSSSILSRTSAKLSLSLTLFWIMVSTAESCVSNCRPIFCCAACASAEFVYSKVNRPAWPVWPASIFWTAIFEIFVLCLRTLAEYKTCISHSFETSSSFFGFNFFL